MILYFVLVSFIWTCQASLQSQSKDSLSDQNHHTGPGHEHNPGYDHDAFLGKDEAKQFDKLTPDESKDKLGKLFHKVDTDNDEKVTEEELKKWIQLAQDRNMREDANRQMKENDLNLDGHITWDEYRKVTYGFLGVNEGDEIISRDEKRFKLADIDNDVKLRVDEFAAFLYPENHDHMKQIIVDEYMEEMDKNRDGTISLEEYLSYLLPEEDLAKGEEPDWVKTEREQFIKKRDKNKDGLMDSVEVRNWILSPDGDHVSTEAKHLLSQSDTDGDGKISKEEMVGNYDLFVGSQATDFEANHEEL